MYGRWHKARTESTEYSVGWNEQVKESWLTAEHGDKYTLKGILPLLILLFIRVTLQVRYSLNYDIEGDTPTFDSTPHSSNFASEVFIEL